VDKAETRWVTYAELAEDLVTSELRLVAEARARAEGELAGLREALTELRRPAWSAGWACLDPPGTAAWVRSDQEQSSPIYLVRWPR